MPDFLVDMNVWLRLSDPEHEMFSAAETSTAALLDRGDLLFLSSQVIAEYWRVVTSPGSQRGYGWDIAAAEREVQRMETDFSMLHDGPEVYAKWRDIVRTARVTGASVFDARLVAAMTAHGLTNILTFNVDDFRRYEPWGIAAVHLNDVQ